MSDARLGVVTIGQSPRVDMVPEMLPWLGIDASAVVERGALDGLPRERIAELAPPGGIPGEGAPGEGVREAGGEADAVLATRLADGSGVELAHRHVVGLLTAAVRELERDHDVRASLVVCSSEFPPIPHVRPLLFAEPLLTAGVRGIVPSDERLGVLCPLPEQAAAQESKWRGALCEGAGNVAVRAADPYRPEAVEAVTAAAEQVADDGATSVVLDCMGYTAEAKRAAARATGLPVLLAREVVARLAGAVIA